MYDLKFMRQLYVFYYSFVDLYFCHLILMGRSMESYIDPFAPGFSYTWRTWLTKDGSKVFQFTWWSYVVVHVIRICFLFLYINNKWKYIHYRFGKQAKLELSYFFFKSRYSGLDWHPPVTEAATARPFTSNNMTSLVGPANHNFSTRGYKTFFLSLGFKNMFQNPKRNQIRSETVVSVMVVKIFLFRKLRPGKGGGGKQLGTWMISWIDIERVNMSIVYYQSKGLIEGYLDMTCLPYVERPLKIYGWATPL